MKARDIWIVLIPHIYQACSAFELHESQDSYVYGPMHLWMMRSFYMLQCQKDEHSCHPPCPEIIIHLAYFMVLSINVQLTLPPS